MNQIKEIKNRTKNKEKIQINQISCMKCKLEENQSKKTKKKTDLTDQFYERQIRRRSKQKTKKKDRFNRSIL